MMDIPPPQSAIDPSHAQPDAFMVHLSQSKLPSAGFPHAHDASIQSSEERAASLFSDERLNERERYLKRVDPETFLYMMVLRLIGRNPDAKVTNSNHRRFALDLVVDDDNNRLVVAGNTRFEGAVLGRHKRRPRND